MIVSFMALSLSVEVQNFGGVGGFGETVGGVGETVGGVGLTVGGVGETVGGVGPVNLSLVVLLNRVSGTIHKNPGANVLSSPWDSVATAVNVASLVCIVHLL